MSFAKRIKVNNGLNPRAGCASQDREKPMIRHYFIALLTGVFALTFSAAQAAPFPERPIRLVIPYPPGGTTDVMARAMQEPLSKILGQPIIIDNRPGAAGAIGAREVARATPDGHTLLFSAPLLYSLLQKDASFDQVNGLSPISLVSTQALLLVANVDVPVTSVGSFLAYVRQQPKPVLYASSGIGSPSHVSTEFLAQTAGLRLTHVPYKGSAPAALAAMSGEVQFTMTSATPSMMEYVRAGKLRLLGASTTSQTLPPDVPLISADLPAFKVQLWWGIFGPPAMAAETMEKLNAAIREVIADPAVQKLFIAAGFSPAASSSDEFKAFVASDMELWKRVIAEGGITAE